MSSNGFSLDGNSNYGGSPPSNNNYQKSNSYGNNNGGGYQNKFGGNSNWTPPPADGKIYLAFSVFTDQETPPEVLEKIKNIATEIGKKEWVLRCLADNVGSDVAKTNFDGKKEMVVPWPDFGGEKGDYKTQNPAKAIACRFQPGLSQMKPVIWTITGAQIHSVLGKDLKSHSKFLITWTPDGVERWQEKTSRTGRMGMGIAVASWSGIPVFNLYNPDAMERLTNLVMSYNQSFEEGDFHPDQFKFKKTTEV